MVRDMPSKSKAQIFVVDDDTCILDSVAVFLNKAGLECTCFESAEACLDYLRRENCDLLITDIRMPGMDGMELLVEVKKIVPWMPVLIMTSYSDVPLVVKAVKKGAADFVEKPLEWGKFLALVKLIVEQNDLGNLFKGKPLTKTEKNVLWLILQGKTNKEMASVLCRSVRTVEVHRSHIMQKLDADSIVDLVRRATALGLDDIK